MEGYGRKIDGWLLPAFEEIRIKKLRDSVLEPQDFYPKSDGNVQESLIVEQLTPRVADVHGILMPKDPNPIPSTSRLIPTQTSIKVLCSLAVHLHRRLPVLISSPPSSGKSLILEHLAGLLHPASPHQVISVHLSDTSIDAKSLLGSYISSTKRPGTFEWQEGVVVRAMRRGLWLVLEDVDRAGSEVLGTLLPLVESLSLHRPIGQPAHLEVPGHGKVEAAETFAIFATRSVVPFPDGTLPSASFLGANKYSHVDMPAPSEEELLSIVSSKFPSLGIAGAKAIIRGWSDARAL
ncbi:hypothetical protein M422DRAFT_267986, partial [Sphaerobolus stellatus SS14]